MTEASAHKSGLQFILQGGRCSRYLSLGLAAVLLSTAAGCATFPWNPFEQSEPLPQLAQSTSAMVLDGNGGVVQTSATTAVSNPALEAALDLFRQEKYYEAQRAFHKIARNKNSSPRDAEKALYYEAECLRMRQYLKAASEVYSQQIKEYPRGEHSQLAMKRMFDIADYWLQETRAEMIASNERKSGKRYFVWPVALTMHFDKTKPILDIEGRAVALLEKVYLNDIDGPLGEKALYYLGGVNFYRGNYHEADHFFSQVVRWHPNGQYAAKSLELSIVCKQMSTGGSAYDGRSLAEARKLVHLAYEAYPELAHEKSDFLQRQIYSINMQQADADFNAAEFYRRTGHPGSAYFSYEIVRRRYPGTKYAEQAEKRMHEMREALEREKSGNPGGITGVLNWLQQSITGTPPSQEQATPSNQPPNPALGEQLPQPRTLEGMEQLPQPRSLQEPRHLPPELGQGGGYQ